MLNLGWLKMDTSKCFNSTGIYHCGYIYFYSKYWRFELWGVNWLSSEVHFIPNGIKNPTRIYVGGHWGAALATPGAAARNRYADDLYKHQEHWITLGMRSSWEPYIYAM